MSDPVHPGETDRPLGDVAAIEVRGLRTAFGDHVVHDNLDLMVRRGEVMGVVGGSGSGKSVLLNSIIGLRTPQAGTISVLGHELQRASRRSWSELERSWGVLFQHGALFSNLTVRENVTAPMFEHTKMTRAEAAELADLKIAMVGLRPDAGALKPSELSGGMRKRAALARALALEPKLLFLDEPGSGLDPLNAARLDALVLELRHHLGTTVVMVTHDIASVFAVADRALYLDEQAMTMTALGAPQDLLQQGPPAVQRFLAPSRAGIAAAANIPEALP